MGALSELWKKAKADFEKTTGKKKPSESTWGFFRKASGIEAPLESLEQAKTEAERKQSLMAFTKAKDAYVKLLEQHLIDPSNHQTYKVEVQKLKEGLQKIAQVAQGDIAKMLAPRKGKIGPLNFDLLNGVPRPPLLELPKRVAVIVEIEAEFAGDDILLAQQLTEAASNFMDSFRSGTVAKLVRQANEIYTKMGEAGKVEEAIAGIQKFHELLRKQAEKAGAEAKAQVDKKGKELANRSVDLKVYKVNTATHVIFDVVKVGTAAKDIFTMPVIGVLTTLISIALTLKDAYTTIKTYLNDVIKVRTDLDTALKELEKKRQAQLHEKEGDEAENLMNQVLEGIMDNVKGAEKLLQAFGVKVTEVDHKSKEAAAQLSKLLEIDSFLMKRGGWEEITGQIKEMIPRIQQSQGNYQSLLKDEANFQESLELVKKDATKTVKTIKFIMDASSLLDPVEWLERGCNALAAKAQARAKA